MVDFNNYAKRVGKKWHHWKIFVDEETEVLDTIESVQYVLHPTFPNPVRVVFDRESRFALEATGHGAFPIFATIKFIDGRQEKYRYDLDLNKKWPLLPERVTDCDIGELASSLDEIRRLSKKAWKEDEREFFVDYSPEGHSERVIQLIDSICRDMMLTEKRLNHQEVFILLASSYLHDIGVQYTGKPKRTLEQIRKNHHIYSERMILGSVRDRSKHRSLGVPKDFAFEIAKVCKAHRQSELDDKEFNSVEKNGETIRIRLLAALLSLAVSLDITERRIFVKNLQAQDLPQERRVHWWRFHYIKTLSVEGGRICIHFVFPSKDYEMLVARSIEDEIDKRLNSFREIMWQNAIRLFIGDHIVEYSSAKLPLTQEDLIYLREDQKLKQEDRRKRKKRDISKVVSLTRDAAELNVRHRRYSIALDYHEFDPDVLQGIIEYSSVVRNETNETREIFPEGKVCDGSTTIPQSLRRNPPKNPEMIFSFEKMKIDGRPEKCDVRIRYLNPKDRAKGIVRDVRCSKDIPPKTSIAVRYVERILLDKVDTISRRFWGLSYGIVEVHVRHPSTILPDIAWYSRKETHVKTAALEKSATLAVFIAEGKWMPGSGFLLSWRTRE